MTQMLEQTMLPAVPAQLPNRSPTSKLPPRGAVRIGLFFDGTGNNRVNTTHRIDKTDVYKKYKGEGSYANDYSNVARLEAYIVKEPAPAGYEHYLSIYTEGIGTEDADEDDMVPGQSMGQGPTGVLAKVEKGLLNAAAEASARLPRGMIIEKLTVDVFGFSRGAAVARYCVYRVRNTDTRTSEFRPSLKRLIEATGRSVEQIETRAVGLYDTVSAIGVPSDESDVEELKLDAIRDAQAVLQLAAAEEYRENFSLTDIMSAGAKGKELYLPGAHSDIGGGYAEGEMERKTIIKGASSRSLA